jgi:hypothetical protein
MVFTAEYEFALRASAMALVITAWIFARFAFGQPLLHPWLGALCAGLLSALTSIVAVVPGVGPAPEVVVNAAGFMTGLLFCAGVRYEAVHAPLRRRAVVTMVGSALALAVVLESAVRAPSVRLELVQLIVGLTVGAAVLWLPRLMRQTAPKIGVYLLAVVAVGVAIDRAFPVIGSLAGRGAPRLLSLLGVESTDIVVIVTAGIAMIVFSAERAHYARARAKTREV